MLLDEAQDGFDAVSGAICGERDVDKAVSICFSCFSGGGAARDAARAALAAYVAALRGVAPQMLAD